MLSSHSIFISYRRIDSEDITGRLYDRLSSYFGRNVVFKDVDSIPYGVDFHQYLERSLSQCRVVLAVIGDKWLSELMQRAQTSGVDWVAEEIGFALRQNVIVIPILVKEARVPSVGQLPAELKPMASRHAAAIRKDPDFHIDVDRLIRRLDKVLDSSQPSAQKNEQRVPLADERLLVLQTENILKKQLGKFFRYPTLITFSVSASILAIGIWLDDRHGFLASIALGILAEIISGILVSGLFRRGGFFWGVLILLLSILLAWGIHFAFYDDSAFLAGLAESIGTVISGLASLVTLIIHWLTNRYRRKRKLQAVAE